MKIINRCRYWGQVLLLPVYWLSFFIPRDKNIWLFGSTFGRRFADNPRYLYLYVSQHREELGKRPIWISHNKEIVAFLNENGYEAYYYHSLKGIWYALRGKVYLYDNYSKDINFWQSGGALKFNMWHGIPLKKIQADNKHDKFRHPNNLWEKWRNFPRNLSDEKPSDYVLTTSKELVPIFSSAFRTKNVIPCGYPRNDYLISHDIENLLFPVEQQEVDAVEQFRRVYGTAYTGSSDDDFAVNSKPSKDTKIVYYMPTFRDSEMKFFEVMDLGRFQEYLAQENILFCVKLHPKSKLGEEFAAIAHKGFGNILIVDADSDAYVLLKQTDVLVTDYSSIYFDFLLLDRPIIFFDYDREEYLEQSRELYFDYEDMTPGEKAETMEGLMAALLHACYPTGGYDSTYTNQRKRIRDKVFDTPADPASPKLVKVIQEVM